MKILRKDYKGRFWRNVVRGKNEDDCWGWCGYLDTNGYPQMMVKTKVVMASHLSYEINISQIPKGKGYHGICVLHICDNPNCTNPKHLRLGTHKDNMLDMKNKGRVSKNEKHSRAKHTWAIVRKIRKLYKTGEYSHRQLGQMFDVSHTGIGGIVRNKLWVC